MNRKSVFLVALGITVLVLPFLLSAGLLFLATSIVISILFATSTNLLFGRAGVPSFGQAAFYGAGAYGVALATKSDFSLPLALLIALIAAALLSLVAALVTYRLTGLAFSMVTLALAQMTYLIVIKNQTLGGYDGIPGVVAPQLGPIDPGNKTTLWFIVVAVVVVSLWLLHRIWNSPFGQSLAAIKSDPVRASYLGINVRAFRAIAFIIAGSGAGIAGGLMAYSSQIVTSDMLAWTESAIPIIMLLMGGSAYFWGPAIGAILLGLSIYFLNQVSNLYLLFVGLILLLILLVLPNGILSLPGKFSRDRQKNESGVPTP